MATSSPAALGAASGQAVGSNASGIVFMALAISLFAMQNAMVKWLAADYGTVQIIFFRHAVALLPIGIFLWRAGGLPLLHTSRRRAHIVRSLLGLVATAAIFYSFGQMPLANATAIAFTVPIFITALSVPLLGEQVGWRRWSAVFVGFAGIMIVLQPGPDMLDPAALILIGGCLVVAYTMILSRQMSRTEHTATISGYVTIIGVAATAIILPFTWITPVGIDWLIFGGIGLLGGVGFMLVTQAYRVSQAAVVAPFEYIHILWAIVLGYFVWGEIPDTNVAIGALVVIASGLYIVHRETVRARPPLARHKIHPRV
ncbi:MAG: DMT family transporter [Alphaproteobacteria bacterium]